MENRRQLSSFPSIWIGIAIVLLSRLLQAVLPDSYTEPTVHGDMGGVLLFYLLIISANLGYWLFCVHRLHKILWEISGNAYPITPPQAVVGHIVPFYNLYWIFKWTDQIVEFHNERSETNQMAKGIMGIVLLGAAVAGILSNGIPMVVLIAVIGYLNIKIGSISEVKSTPSAKVNPLELTGSAESGNSTEFCCSACGKGVFVGDKYCRSCSEPLEWETESEVVLPNKEPTQKNVKNVKVAPPHSAEAIHDGNDGKNDKPAPPKSQVGGGVGNSRQDSYRPSVNGIGKKSPQTPDQVVQLKGSKDMEYSPQVEIIEGLSKVINKGSEMSYVVLSSDFGFPTSASSLLEIMAFNAFASDLSCLQYFGKDGSSNIKLALAYVGKGLDDCHGSREYSKISGLEEAFGNHLPMHLATPPGGKFVGEDTIGKRGAYLGALHSLYLKEFQAQLARLAGRGDHSSELFFEIAAQSSVKRLSSSLYGNTLIPTDLFKNQYAVLDMMIEGLKESTN